MSHQLNTPPCRDPDELEHRRKVLEDVLEEYHRQKLVPNQNAIIKSMKHKGYPDYNRNKLFADRTALNSQSNYIRYFLPNYSAYQENINRLLQFVAEQCETLYHRTYTQSKKTTRTVSGPKGQTEVTEEVITAEDPQPKLMALNTLLRATKLMHEHSHGQNVHIGAVVLQKEFERMNADLEKLQQTQYNPKNLPVLKK